MSTFSSVRRVFRRVHSPVVFAGIVAAFFLPFATVSCDGAETTFTGVQLVTKTVPEGGVIDEEEGEISDRVESESSGVAAIIISLAVAGFFVGVFGIERGPGWIAALGILLTIVLGANTESATVDYRVGYKLVFALFIWAGVLHLGRALARGRGMSKEPPPVGVRRPGY
jgi:hypothetical protein